jgi:hypothetical protein
LKNKDFLENILDKRLFLCIIYSIGSRNPSTIIDLSLFRKEGVMPSLFYVRISTIILLACLPAGYSIGALAEGKFFYGMLSVVTTLLLIVFAFYPKEVLSFLESLTKTTVESVAKVSPHVIRRTKSSSTFISNQLAVKPFFWLSVAVFAITFASIFFEKVTTWAVLFFFGVGTILMVTHYNKWREILAVIVTYKKQVWLGLSVVFLAIAVAQESPTMSLLCLVSGICAVITITKCWGQVGIFFRTLLSGGYGKSTLTISGAVLILLIVLYLPIWDNLREGLGVICALLIIASVIFLTPKSK